MRLAALVHMRPRRHPQVAQTGILLLEFEHEHECGGDLNPCGTVCIHSVIKRPTYYFLKFVL